MVACLMRAAPRAAFCGLAKDFGFNANIGLIRQFFCLGGSGDLPTAATADAKRTQR